jgi:heat shock protein HslJ
MTMDQTMSESGRGRAGARRRGRRGLLILAAGAMGLAACSHPGAPPPKTTTTTTTAPRPGACRPIDFTNAEVVLVSPPSTPARYSLTVAGMLPDTRHAARLQPVEYIQQPEFWLIQVLSCEVADVGAPVNTLFKISLDLTGHLGTRGIEVNGATRHQRIEVPPNPAPPLANTGWVLDPASLGVPTTGKLITLNFTATNLGGNSACNRYNAPYIATGSPTGGALEVGPVSSTLIGCAPDIANAESTYLRKLGAADSYAVADAILTLSGPQGSLVFGTPPPTLP